MPICFISSIDIYGYNWSIAGKAHIGHTTKCMHVLTKQYIELVTKQYIELEHKETYY